MSTEYTDFVTDEAQQWTDYAEAVKNKQKPAWYAYTERSTKALGASSLKAADCPKSAGYKIAGDAIALRKRAVMMRNRKRNHFFTFAVVHAQSKADQLNAQLGIVRELTEDF